MSLIKSFITKKEELGYEKAILASLKFLLCTAARKISALLYCVTGMIDYHFNPNALKQSSIEPFIDNEKIKCKSFAVDLHIPPAKNDSRLIECDATSMPFDDESISKIALHCAYEMFENDADVNLIEEANRVLTGGGGKMVILPLYMAHFYHILSSPKANRKGIEYGKAKRVWRDDKYSVRFSRHYSVEAFKERIANHKDKSSLKIFYFTNEKEMKQKPEDRVYAKFAACFAKEKREIDKL